MIKRIVAFYYSPAGGTAKMTMRLAREVAQRIGESIPEALSIESRNLYEDGELPEIDNETIVILGMPVYVGKIPLPAIKRLKEINGGGAMALALVSYSGRNYGNALFELDYFAGERNFKVVGAGAISISYRAARAGSKADSVIMDVDALADYAKAASNKILRLGGSEVEELRIKPAPLEVRGRLPVHRVSKISPRAAAITQDIIERISVGRKESEWFL